MTAGFHTDASEPDLHLQLSGRLTARTPSASRRTHRRLRRLDRGRGGQYLKLDITHWSDFERIAIVGDLKKWQDMMVRFSSPFTKAELKSFGPEQLTDANAWLDS
jgi:hypothetical protein